METYNDTVGSTKIEQGCPISDNLHESLRPNKRQSLSQSIQHASLLPWLEMKLPNIIL